MYRQYSIAYQTALQNYNACTDNSMRSHLKDGLHDAWQTWGELGYRDEIDLARQTIDSITRKGLLSRRENAKHTLLTSKLNDPMYGDYLRTSVFPSNTLERQSWTKVSFDASNLSQNTTSSAHTVGATAGRSWLFGLIKVAGNAGVANATSTMTAPDDKSTISFEPAQIPLIRPWFDPALLEAHNWRWANGQKTRMLSDGGNPPAGDLYAYASSVIVACNIEASFKLSESEANTLINNIDASTDVQLGVFSIKAGAEGNLGSSTSASRITENKITSPGMQIIGFVCTPLAKCPDPENGLNWLDD